MDCILIKSTILGTRALLFIMKLICDDLRTHHAEGHQVLRATVVMDLH